ncbi:MAG: HAD-IIB family hydrolase [Terriglobia bacterium]
MSIRMIAVDFDGTLLDSQNQISPANRDAIQAAVSRGVEVVVVTGRRFHSAQPFVAQIPGCATVISSNGARIGSASGEAYYRSLLPREVARQVVAAAEDFLGYAVLIFDQPGRGQLVMHCDAHPAGPVAWYMRTAPECLLKVPSLPVALTAEPLQVMFGGPQAQIEPLEAILRASSAAHLFHLTWTKYLAPNLSLLDVMNRGCSKGGALALWARRRNVAPQEILAIGDNLNDIEMLQHAGQPVLMANHNFDPVPDGWQVTLSNDEDGVAEAIRRYAL